MTTRKNKDYKITAVTTCDTRNGNRIILYIP